MTSARRIELLTTLAILAMLLIYSDYRTMCKEAALENLKALMGIGVRLDSIDKTLRRMELSKIKTEEAVKRSLKGEIGQLPGVQ